MPNFFKINNSVIAREFILYIILFSSFVTIIITTFQTYNDYKHDLNSIQLQLKQIENVHLNSLTAALWTSNNANIITHLEGILKLQDIQYLEVRDKHKTWAKAGNIINKNNIQKKFNLVFKHRDKNITIGELIVNASKAGVYKRIYDKIFGIFITNVIEIAFIATFIYFLFYQLISRHLSTISTYSENHDLLFSTDELTLNRHNKKHDEFDIVVNSINNMHKRLNDQINEISKQKQHLSQTLDSIGDAVITTDNTGIITRLNPVAIKITGWSNEDAISKPLKDIFNIMDSTTRKPLSNPIDEVLTTGKTVYVRNHTTLVAKNGNKYQITDSAAPIYNNDKILGVVLVFNDVTEQHKTRINLIINVADDLWNVCIDESELEDAILNMCINAMHAINDIGIITIETHNQHIFPTEHTNLELKPGAYVVLKITDNGCGIDKSTKEKIFDPFYSTKGDAGLGLSQVYGLVARSHGAINVDSVLKQGTTFTLYFPQYTDYNETKEDEIFKEDNIVDGKESILVVDDEKVLLNLTCEILNGHDYQVFSAENAKDALKILETDHINLLISDIIMPKMDGYALAAIVKKEYPCVKIQLASGYSGDHTSGNIDPELSKKILQKPYGSKELLRCVRLILQ